MFYIENLSVISSGRRERGMQGIEREVNSWRERHMLCFWKSLARAQKFQRVNDGDIFTVKVKLICVDLNTSRVRCTLVPVTAPPAAPRADATLESSRERCKWTVMQYSSNLVVRYLGWFAAGCRVAGNARRVEQ